MPCYEYTPDEDPKRLNNRISDLKDQVNERTRNYCEFINAVY